MNRLLDSILCNRYPFLYQYRDTKTVTQWACCGDGAFSLIDVMSTLIVNHNPTVFATKLKRQHGGIVLECNQQDHYINGVCMAGETLSNYICDLCGAPGTEDKSYSFGIDVIRCKNHISHESEIVDYSFFSCDILKDKPAWARYVSVLSTILYWEVNNERHRSFHVVIDDKNQLLIKFSMKNDFSNGIADVFAGYCNRIDAQSGEVLRNKPPLSNLKEV